MANRFFGDLLEFESVYSQLNKAYEDRVNKDFSNADCYVNFDGVLSIHFKDWETPFYFNLYEILLTAKDDAELLKQIKDFVEGL